MSSASDGLLERFGDYELLFEIASGGMATIALARQVGDAGFERLVALKRVHRHLLSDPEVFAMACDEARLAALVRHPNVVPMIGVRDTGGELVLIQEYVEGASAAKLLKRLLGRGATMPVAVAVRILVDALRGLHAAHEAKDLRGEALDLVHRDVSPQNLMVGIDGITRIIDFGIARAERRMTMTKTGIVKGKIQYMAPEQIEEQAVDRRTDVFAAGVVLFELVTGKRPFGDGPESVVMGRVLIGDADFELVEKQAPELVEPLRSALAVDPDARPSTALELGRALARAVAPADDEQVQALLNATIGDELEALRERIRAVIGGSDASDSEGAHRRAEPSAVASLGHRDLETVGAKEPRTASADLHRSSARLRTAAALLVATIVLLIAVAFISYRADGGRAGTPSPADGPRSSATGAAAASPAIVDQAPLALAPSSGSRPASAAPSSPHASGPRSPVGAPSAAKPASASAAKPADLMPSPYPSR